MEYKKRKRKKSFASMVSLALLCTLAAGVTLAILMDITSNVNNAFKPSEVTCEVTEELENGLKKNVKIKNNGNTEAYIRAKIIVTWQDSMGNVFGESPDEDDFTMSLDLENGWKKGADGFYYWAQPVKSDDEAPEDCTTGILIDSCSPIMDRTPEGYGLNVEIIASAIQSLPSTVVASEWATGVDRVEGKTLIIKEK